MRIGFDLDGVIYPFHPIIRDYIGVPIDSPLIQWDFWNDWTPPMTTEEWKEHFHRGVAEKHVFYKGYPLPGSMFGLARLKSLGHSIHIVTDRPFDGAYEFTDAWLRRESVPFDTLTISPDKTAVSTDIFLDDKPDNVRALIEAGTYGVLRDQPWNREASAQSLPRIKNWLEFINLVKEKNAELSLV